MSDVPQLIVTFAAAGSFAAGAFISAVLIFLVLDRRFGRREP